MQHKNPAFAFLTYDDEHSSWRDAFVVSQDPDGNRMEFQVDCCANAAEAHVYMYIHSFAANPVGVEVDFDSLLAQYGNGIAPETLLLQPEGPPASRRRIVEATQPESSIAILSLTTS